MNEPDTGRDEVRLALLLRPESRSEAGRDMTVRIATSLGLVESSRGAVSISFRVSRIGFEQLFRVAASPVAGAGDELGAIVRPGTVTAGEPQMPTELAPYVEAVSVEPTAVLMAGTEEGP